MLRYINKAKDRNDEGFSLVELLVVIIIIGILAAVAIPLFLNQRAKANDSSAKADASKIGKEIATLWVDNTPATLSNLKIEIIGTTDQSYQLTWGTGEKQDLGPVTTGVELITKDVKALAGGNPDRTDWCVAVKHPDGADKDWQYSAGGGLKKGNCGATTTP